MTENDPIPLEEFGVQSQEELDQRLTRLGIYEREGEIYRAHRLREDARPPSADFIVRRDSDGRYGGNIADLAQDGGEETYGPEDLRFEAYDDRGQYLAAAVSLRGILAVFAQPNRGIRWISDRLAEPEI